MNDYKISDMMRIALGFMLFYHSAAVLAADVNLNLDESQLKAIFEKALNSVKKSGTYADKVACYKETVDQCEDTPNWENDATYTPSGDLESIAYCNALMVYCGHKKKGFIDEKSHLVSPDRFYADWTKQAAMETDIEKKSSLLREAQCAKLCGSGTLTYPRIKYVNKPNLEGVYANEPDVLKWAEASLDLGLCMGACSSPGVKAQQVWPVTKLMYQNFKDALMD